MTDWWAEFMTGDGKPRGTRGEYTHRGKTYQYFKRLDGDWYVDMRRDEDPRHKFSVSLVCDRCGRALMDLTSEHIQMCPYTHGPDGPMPCKMEMLCEGERRKVEKVTPWTTDLTFDP